MKIEQMRKRIEKAGWKIQTCRNLCGEDDFQHYMATKIGYKPKIGVTITSIYKKIFL